MCHDICNLYNTYGSQYHEQLCISCFVCFFHQPNNTILILLTQMDTYKYVVFKFARSVLS